MTEKAKSKGKGQGKSQKQKAKATVIPFPRVEESSIGLMAGINAFVPENYKALINPDTQHVYNLVTTDYILHRHEDVIGMLAGIVKDHPQFGEPTTIINFNGEENARMRSQTIFYDTEYPVGGDLIHPTIDLFNSYDGTWALRGSFGALKLICTNGLTVGKLLGQYRREHHQNPDRKEFTIVIKAGMEAMSDQADLWNKWVDVKVEEAEYRRVMSGMQFNKTELEEIGDMAEEQNGSRLNNVVLHREWINWLADKAGTEHPEFEGVAAPTLSKWILFNIVTQFLTHHVDSMMKRARMEGRLSRLVCS